MRGRSIRGCTLTASLIAAGALGAQTLQPMTEEPVRVAPRRIAAIDADGKIIGDWVEYVDRPRPAGWCSLDLAYDTFWPDPLTGEPIGGDLCYATFSPSDRWSFGCNHHSPIYYDDATFIETVNPVDRHQLAWIWNLTDTCLIRVSVYDMSGYGIQCERVPAGAFRGGFLLDFEELARSCSYFYSDVDLCDIGATFDAPTAQGLIKTEFLQSYDAQTGISVYSPGPVSMMLWGIDPGIGGVGENDAWVLADDDVVNEQIDFPNECYDWGSFGVCPSPLAPMHAFYSLGAPPPPECSIQLFVGTLRQGQRATFTISDATPGRMISIRFSKQPFGTGPPVYGQIGNFCGESELRPLLGIDELCLVVADDEGRASCTTGQIIPFGYQGVTFNFQAFQEGYCPDPCDSPLISRTVVE